MARAAKTAFQPGNGSFGGIKAWLAKTPSLSSALKKAGTAAIINAATRAVPQVQAHAPIPGPGPVRERGALVKPEAVSDRSLSDRLLGQLWNQIAQIVREF